MTDDTSNPRLPEFDEPLHPLDELVSAHLDGLADQAALAAVRNDPDFTARLNLLGRARAAVRTPSAGIDARRREAAIEAALAAFDQLATGAAPQMPDERPAEVASFQVAAARRSLPPRWRAIGIAAAVVAGTLAAVPLLTRDDTPASDTALGADAQESADESSANRTMADSDLSSEYSTGMAAPSMATGKLGEFATYDELASVVRAQLEPPNATTPADASPSTLATTTTMPETPTGDTTTGGSTATPAEDTGGTAADECPPPSEEPVVYEGDATVDGQPVTVEVVDEPDGGRTMEVRDPANCDVVDSRKL